MLRRSGDRAAVIPPLSGGWEGWGVTNAEFEQEYYPKYKAKIRAIARKIAQQNDALVDDLFQEGCVALWELDLTQANTNLDAFIRQAVKFRMIDFMRRERPKLYESLTAHLERGDQVIRDEDTGEVRLLTVRETHRRSLLLDEEDSRAASLLESASDSTD